MFKPCRGGGGGGHLKEPILKRFQQQEQSRNATSIIQEYLEDYCYTRCCLLVVIYIRSIILLTGILLLCTSYNNNPRNTACTWYIHTFTLYTSSITSYIIYGVRCCCITTKSTGTFGGVVGCWGRCIDCRIVVRVYLPART